jgi:hypothetical protein
VRKDRRGTRVVDGSEPLLHPPKGFVQIVDHRTGIGRVAELTALS